MNALHTVEIVACIKRQMRDLHHKMMDNLDDKFKPVDVELDSSLDNQIHELNEKLKYFSIKERCKLSEMYLRVYA